MSAVKGVSTDGLAENVYFLFIADDPVIFYLR
jgi:hypothetical protein